MNKTTEKCKGPFKEFLAHILPWKICWYSLFSCVLTLTFILYKLESFFTFYLNIAVGMSRERPADTYMWAYMFGINGTVGDSYQVLGN